jgi:putative PIN family toxin of toxin-antitoxin system
VRVLFYTNVLISALLFPGGHGETALFHIIAGQDRLLISQPLLHELLTVLARKFSHDREELARMAVFLGDLAEMINPKIQLQILEDEPDNRVLECAIAGKADSIVTGDKAILQLGTFQGIHILFLRDYLAKT